MVRIALALTLVLAGARAQAGEDEPYLSDVRQLTDGGRAGEAYFSPDGQQILYQAVRDGHPYYQIYVMNADGSERRMVSTGKGKTTCAFFHPTRPGLFIYASSHLDARTHAAPPPGSEGRGYRWDYDDAFDIFLASTEDGAIVRRLTDATGYDAECSFSPDGETIAFTARREGKPDAIWLMDADGTDPRPLVQRPDLVCGGPFFSPDGQWVLYRANPDGQRVMHSYLTSLDGKVTRKLTRAARVNWAPFFHPDGEYVAYAANAPGSHKNFDIFLVKADGSGREVQLTADANFDGIPSFSPDGQTLLWTSQRHGGEPQVFRARLQIPGDAAFAVPEAPPAGRPGGPGSSPHGGGSSPHGGDSSPHGGSSSREAAPGPTLVHPSAGAALAPLPGLERIAAPRLREHAAWLADDARDGRRAGTPGARAAADYLARSLARAGARPGGLDGSWFVPFTYTRGARRAAAGNALRVADQPWELGREWQPLLYSASGAVEGQLVFCGYGIRNDEAGYDDFAGIDVTGKVAIVLTGGPHSSRGGAFGAEHPTVYEDLRYKVAACRDAGAAGAVLVRARDEGWLQLSAGDPGIPVVQVDRGALERRLGVSVRAWTDAIEAAGAPRSEHLRGIAAVSVALERVQVGSRNVIGRFDGSERPDEVIVVGAHYDHLGRGGDGSLATEEGAIHNGADDNASGVAGLIALAEGLAAARPRRTVLLVGFGSEEEGLVGSKRFVDEPPVARERIVAMLNMDMIGRKGDRPLLVGGAGTSPAWPPLLQAAADRSGQPISTQRDGFGPSDHASFYAADIPVLFLWTGTHADYHKPSDDVERLDTAGLLHAAQVAYGLLRGIDALPRRPEFVRVARSDAPQRVVTGERGAYFGSIPDYAQDGGDGVLMDGAREGTPAAQAGLRKGDVLVRFAGRPVKTIHDFVNALRLARPGETVEVVVRREGGEVTLTATLGVSARKR